MYMYMNNHVHSAPQLERKKRTEKKERRITHYVHVHMLALGTVCGGERRGGARGENGDINHYGVSVTTILLSSVLW